ncbi:MAG: TetR/AcrR family transcriptional regulator [Planctomycetes bacterium]|nr:TetR/AcrR family transcriptional regulator [Planctomycetota bacterium]
MEIDSPQPRRRRSEKGARTRERIFQTALRRFQADGFHSASLRAIAEEAGVTPALCYRYFESKDALVGEVYGRLLDQWVERSRAMPAGTWTARTLWLTRMSMEVLGPYRPLLGALLMPMLQGHPTVSPLHNRDSREKGAPQFLRAVVEAEDAPRHAEELADAAYLAQLAILFFWAVDRSRDQRATQALLAAVEGASPLIGIGLKLPFVGPKLLAIGRSVRLGLMGEGQPGLTPEAVP